MADDEDTIYGDWVEGRDPERSLAGSAKFLQAVVDGRVDPSHYRDYMTFALDRHLDGPDGDPALVMRAVREAAGAFRRFENVASRQTRISARAEYLVMRARALHRLGYSHEGSRWAYQGMHYLEKEAGGFEAFLDAMGSLEHNVIAQNATNVLAIAAASARRANYDDQTRDRLFNQYKALFGAYVLAGHDPVIYPRTSAMAAQMLYLLAGDAKPEDRGLVRKAWSLDVTTRSHDARAQATVGLRDHAYYKYLGDLATARQSGEDALLALRDFPLPRHSSFVTRWGYLAA